MNMKKHTYSTTNWKNFIFTATKKPYAEISIAEITRKANVSRTSFTAIMKTKIQ